MTERSAPRAPGEPAAERGFRARALLPAATRALPVALVVAALALALFAVPAVFTIDEDHYLMTVLALRQGRVTVPGTDGLTPSAELHWFDPRGFHLAQPRIPVGPTVPPLYAAVALPFAALGWRGLILLNAASFAGVAWLVFRTTRARSDSALAPWLALAAFALGGYGLEYAQGVWPHMLAALLVLAAAALAFAPSAGGKPTWLLAAGLLAGLATGVRYQNVVLAAALGAGVWLVHTARPRWRAPLLFAAGLAVPLVASAAINAARLGAGNPISKGPDYLAVSAGTNASRPLGRAWESVRMGWAQIVDYSKRPPLTAPDMTVFIGRDEPTGAYVYRGVVKKAWLQSSPWIVLALFQAAFAWWPGGAPPSPRRRAERALGMAIVLMLAAFSLAGARRHDGLCYNQRYFLELVPLAAVLFGWSVESKRLRGATVAAALFAAASIAWIWLVVPLPASLRAATILFAPLALATVLAGLWLFSPGRGPATANALSVGVGCAIGWALAIHVVDDVAASRQLREENLARQRVYAELLPESEKPTAFFAYWGMKDAVGPLLLRRDVVVADARFDDGATMASLIRDFHAAGRRVVVSAAGFPPPLLRRALAGFSVRRLPTTSAIAYEVEP